MSELRWNFFQYATRELSHSAVFAWLMSSLDPDLENAANPAEAQRFATGLLDQIFDKAETRTGKERSVDSDSLRSVRVETECYLPTAKKQGRFDVFVRLEDANQAVGIGVETKLRGKRGKGQLQRYTEALETLTKEEETERKVDWAQMVYLKLGERMDETLPEESGVVEIYADDVLQVFESCGQSVKEHPILGDFHQWLQLNQPNELRNRIKAGESWATDLSDSQIAQYYFMKWVFRLDSYNVDPYKSDFSRGVPETFFADCGTSHVLARGTSWGRPFVTYQQKPENVDIGPYSNFYFRLDNYSRDGERQPCLSPRLYENKERRADNKKRVAWHKENDVESLRTAIAELLSKERFRPLGSDGCYEPSKKTWNYRESEIGRFWLLDFQKNPADLLVMRDFANELWSRLPGLLCH